MSTQEDWRGLARRYARKYGFPEDVFERQMGQEAHGQDLRSSAGAQGPAQIMPATARAWGVTNPHDIHQAYDAAAKHMAAYVKQYGSVRNALIAYNAGPGAIGKNLPGETQNYLKIIMGGHGGGSSPPRSSGGAVASMASVSGGPPGTSVVAPGSGGDDRLNTLAQVFQRLDAATPKLQYNSPFSRTDDSAPSGVAGQTQTSAPDEFQVPQSSFQPTKVEVQQPSLADTLSSLAASRSPSSPTAPGISGPGGGSDVPGAPAPTAKGTTTFDKKPVANWIAPILQYAREHGWKGSVNSGFRSFADQTRIYNSGVRPAAKPGTSNHEGAEFPRGAVDVSDAATLSAILKKSKYANLLVWAGGKDPPHFSHPHGGSY